MDGFEVIFHIMGNKAGKPVNSSAAVGGTVKAKRRFLGRRRKTSPGSTNVSEPDPTAGRRPVDPDFLEKLQTHARKIQVDNAYRSIGGLPEFLSRTDDPFVLVYSSPELQHCLQLILFLTQNLDQLRGRFELLGGALQIQLTNTVPKFQRELFTMVLNYAREEDERMEAQLQLHSRQPIPEDPSPDRVVPELIEMEGEGDEPDQVLEERMLMTAPMELDLDAPATPPTQSTEIDDAGTESSMESVRGSIPDVELSSNSKLVSHGEIQVEVVEDEIEDVEEPTDRHDSKMSAVSA